jgi:hypothetical protein
MNNDTMPYVPRTVLNVDLQPIRLDQTSAGVVGSFQVSGTKGAAIWLLVRLYYLLAFSPLFIIVGLYLLSWRGAVLIGHWPLLYIDDPKYIGNYDWLYNLLSSAVGWLFLASCFSIVVFPVLTLVLRNWLSYRGIVFWVLAYAVGIVYLLLEPTHRIAWLLD